jgi:hypothetical protein
MHTSFCVTGFVLRSDEERSTWMQLCGQFGSRRQSASYFDLKKSRCRWTNLYVEDLGQMVAPILDIMTRSTSASLTN